jgi:putative phosphoribosyl transferase
MSTFSDRHHAGRVLASFLQRYRNTPDTLILGLPRGGVVVAYEVARALNLPLDVFAVRKLGVPGYEELALGAIASGGHIVVNQDVLRQFDIDQRSFESIAAEARLRLARLERDFRGDRPPIDVRGKTVILVDDGLATGATMRSAAQALHQMHPGRIVIAVPVGAQETCDEFRHEADEVVCAETPRPFFGVGAWYRDFGQTDDEEVRQLLNTAWGQWSDRAREAAVDAPAGRAASKHGEAAPQP